ncbi:hypothetical protein BD413DRAFT_458596, partial [Trametes elegans]
VLVYPPSGTGAVNITRGDLKRLDNGQYLNDTLIEFGLKVWLDDLRMEQPDLAEKVYIFNSFFFKKLNSKKEPVPSCLVRKWTSKVDIFSKKYIIVPINENFHWYLAIIVNPDCILHPPPPETRVAPHTRKRKRDEQLPAHIYTFDSLGSRHPRTVSKLAQYLQHEAVDKKKFQIEDTCIAQYKLAKAPMQKNFCDCGLFVLAFVKAFMADPARSIERI